PALLNLVGQSFLNRAPKPHALQSPSSQAIQSPSSSSLTSSEADLQPVTTTLLRLSVSCCDQFKIFLANYQSNNEIAAA
ncbi:hypothetical protein AVEN_252770-1, partial [Araneus ventricosus]